MILQSTVSGAKPWNQLWCFSASATANAKLDAVTKCSWMVSVSGGTPYVSSKVMMAAGLLEVVQWVRGYQPHIGQLQHLNLGGRIRTCDLRVPDATLMPTELHPENEGPALVSASPCREGSPPSVTAFSFTLFNRDH